MPLVLFRCTGLNFRLNSRNSTQCETCLIEEGATQAPEAPRTSGWPFHKKLVASSRRAEGWEAHILQNEEEPDQARLSGTPKTSPAGRWRMAMWQWPVSSCGPQPLTCHGKCSQFAAGKCRREGISDLIKGGLFPWPSLDHNYFLQ